MIFGLSGRMASGKDTTADYIIDRYGGRRMAFADWLKTLARDLICEYFAEDVDPWTDKSPKIRRFLQILGTDVMRAYDDDVWVRHAMAEVDRAVDLGREHVVFTDVRFPNEAEAIIERGGIIIRCDVSEWQRLARLAALYGDATPAAHISETALDGFQPQTVIRTDTVETMELHIEMLMHHLGVQPLEVESFQAY